MKNDPWQWYFWWYDESVRQFLLWYYWPNFVLGSADDIVSVVSLNGLKSKS